MSEHRIDTSSMSMEKGGKEPKYPSSSPLLAAAYEQAGLERVDRTQRKGGVGKSVLSLQPAGVPSNRAARRAQARPARRK
ncbi:hypothetical protein ACFV9E_15015 [Streptomyces sp. NPDC059835]|uniref:hypothetical protein n=1 Tax=Streptomyces sp. NPDC059835 TaxID=3346967 RepID=UPI0036517005